MSQCVLQYLCFRTIIQHGQPEEGEGGEERILPPGPPTHGEPLNPSGPPTHGEPLNPSGS